MIRACQMECHKLLKHFIFICSCNNELSPDNCEELCCLHTLRMFVLCWMVDIHWRDCAIWKYFRRKSNLLCTRYFQYHKCLSLKIKHFSHIKHDLWYPFELDSLERVTWKFILWRWVLQISSRCQTASAILFNVPIWMYNRIPLHINSGF